MGVGGIGIVQLLVVLVIVILLFGTKKLKNMGGDIGGAIRNFKKAVKGSSDEVNEDEQLEDTTGEVIDGEVVSKQEDKV